MISLKKDLINRFKFIKFNKKIYPKNKKNKKNIVLVEYFTYEPSILAFSIFSNFLSSYYNAEIQMYHPRALKLKDKILGIFNKMFFLSKEKIYNSFGVKKLILPKIKNSDEANKIFKNLKAKINKKEDILNLKIKQIPIGDLIYDEFLRKFNKSTIEYKSKIFEDHLKTSIKLFLFWEKKLDKYTKVLVISHSVYFTGLPARIAIFKNIKVFNIGMNYIYSLDKKYFRRLSGFENYKKIFGIIKKLVNYNIYNFAKKEIKQKFIGKLDVTQIEAKDNRQTSFGNNRIKKLVNLDKSKKNILVASHCFTDAVHAYGKNFFVDYEEWIHSLGKYSLKNKKYNWLIKLHPAEFDRNRSKMEKITRNFPSFKILPKNTTHNELVKLGIEAVLTVYGSVGYEYPFFKIPVINASNYGPHISYNFNYYPKNKKDYFNTLDSINKIKKDYRKNYKIHIKEASEFYFTRFLSNYEFLSDLNNLIKKLKYDYGTSEIFDYFIKNYNYEELKEKNKMFNKFLKSKKNRIYADNYNRESKPILFY